MSAALLITQIPDSGRCVRFYLFIDCYLNDVCALCTVLLGDGPTGIAVRMHPLNSFELLFFAVFGQTTTEQTQVDKIKNLATPTQPYWVEYLFKIVFGVYMLVSVVVLINLLIAMMSDTYQRIQVVSHNHPHFD